jgi:hypothetical protein
MAGKSPKKCMTIISLARVQHQRAMFKVMHKMDRLSDRLAQVFHAKKMGRSGLEHAYFSLFYQPSELRRARGKYH